MAQYKLRLSKEADQDLSHIYEDGLLRWGERQADTYFDALFAHFDALSENPYLFQAVDEIRKGYRRSVCGKHAIYYRVVNDAVEIMGLIKHQNRFGAKL